MLLTAGHAVIQPAAAGKPPQLLFRRIPTQITAGAQHLPVLHGPFFCRKLPGNIFAVCVEYHVNLFLTVLRRPIIVNGIIFQNGPGQPLQDQRRVVGVALCPVERLVLVKFQIVDGIFQTSAALKMCIRDR